MDVNLNNAEVVLNLNSLRTATVNPAGGATKAETLENGETVDNNVKDIPQLSHDDVKNITQELNKFLELINTDLQFDVHEETKQLIVQVVDTKNQKILKEFPPHELLDTIAKIRDYVGILLDKKV